MPSASLLAFAITTTLSSLGNGERCNFQDNLVFLQLLWVATDFLALPVAAAAFTLALMMVRCRNNQRVLVRDVTLALLTFSLPSAEEARAPA